MTVQKFIVVFFAAGWICGCGASAKKNDGVKPDGTSSSDGDEQEEGEKESTLAELYTNEDAQACHAAGKIVDLKLNEGEWQVLCTEKIADIECTSENLKKIVIPEDIPAIEKSLASGSVLLQCEDLGAGVRVDWLSADGTSVGGAATYRFAAQNLLNGTWQSEGCKGRSKLSIEFDAGRFVRVYDWFPDDECAQEKIGTFKTEGKVTAAMSGEKIGVEQLYHFDLAIDKYTINVTDASKVDPSDFGEGCIEGLTESTDLVLTTASCLRTEYISAIYVDERIDGKDLFGFAFPSRDRAWESVDKDDRVAGGFGSNDFHVYKEGVVLSE